MGPFHSCEIGMVWLVGVAAGAMGGDHSHGGMESHGHIHGGMEGDTGQHSQNAGMASMYCGATDCPSSVKLIADAVAMHAGTDASHTGMAIRFSCDNAVDLARGMAPHHSGAVQMCQTLFAYTTAGVPTADHMAARDPVLHTLCNSIVATQNKEIDFLERWLAEHAGPAGTCGGDDAVALLDTHGMGMPMGCYDLNGRECVTSGVVGAYVQVNADMHVRMAGSMACDPNLDFVHGMIPHHVGAVDMCSVYTAFRAHGIGASEHVEVTSLCANITAAQNAEVAQLKAWLAARGYDPDGGNYSCMGASAGADSCPCSGVTPCNHHGTCERRVAAGSAGKRPEQWVDEGGECEPDAPDCVSAAAAVPHTSHSAGTVGEHSHAAGEHSPSMRAGARKDPHLSFAHGGHADFRGRNGAYYGFFSEPGLAVNVKVEEASFSIKRGALTVDGTFLTELHVVARVGGTKRKLFLASFWASELNENNWGWRVINGSCAGHVFQLGKGGFRRCEELGIEVEALELAWHLEDCRAYLSPLSREQVDMASAAFSTRNWTITVRGNRVHGHISARLRAKGPRSRPSHPTLCAM